MALGKRVAQRTYLHVSAIDEASEEYQQALNQAETLSGISQESDFNVIRFELASDRITLLSYPAFFDESFPVLRDSWSIDFSSGECSHRTYVNSLNPPILHRKELLISVGHSRRSEFEALTRSAESIGLFDEPKRIGYRRQWLALVREKGYRIEEHSLIPIGNDESESRSEVDLAPIHAGWGGF